MDHREERRPSLSFLANEKRKNQQGDRGGAEKKRRRGESGRGFGMENSARELASSMFSSSDTVRSVHLVIIHFV